jgi:Peptidase family M1 domain/Secretion system C-terminal sorting domain
LSVQGNKPPEISFFLTLKTEVKRAKNTFIKPIKMKKIVILSYILFFAFPSFSQFEYDRCKDHINLVEREQAAHQNLINFKANPLTSDYDVKYHRMLWNIDPAVHYIDGSITTYFEPTVAAFSVLNFDFSTFLSADSVKYHGNNLTFSTANDNLQINLSGPIGIGILDSVTIYYQGAPTGSGFGSFATSTHSGVPVMWTLSEPYGAMEWWPCKQSLNDKIDSIDVYVLTDTAYRAASNGLLVSEVINGADKSYHWKHRYPIPAYLIAIAVTNYAYYTDKVPVPGSDTIDVLNYVFPENLSFIQNQTPNIIPIMDLYNGLFEVYPFASEKYGHAQFGWGGGMEHQTMSFMGGWSFGLQAHELAHQWFGDKVTCGSWEDIWLNEGFATYLTGLTSEHLGSPFDWTSWKAQTIGSVTSQPGGSVWVDDTTSVGRIFNGRLSYSKGAMVLHMARWVLGDTDFYQALQNYLADSSLAYGYARTNDLKYHFETQSGLDMTKFFNDWFYAQGYPSYQMDILSSDSLTYDSIRISQTTSHNSVSFFEMPVQIRFVGPLGVDSTLVFDHTFSGETFELNLGFEPFTAFFDPNFWLLSKNNNFSWGTLLALEDDISVLNRLFPNPVNDILHLDMAGEAEYFIFNELGQKVLTGKVFMGLNEIEMGDLPTGVYIVSLRTEKGSSEHRIILL